MPGFREAAMLKGFLYSIVITLSLLVATAGGDEIIVDIKRHHRVTRREGNSP